MPRGVYVAHKRRLIKRVISTKYPLTSQFYLICKLALTYSSHSLYFSNVGLFVIYFYCTQNDTMMGVQFWGLFMTIDDYLSEGVHGAL